MRINNLEFGECTYIGTPPEHIGWEIRKWYPNSYYKQEDKFIKDGDYYRPDDYRFVTIHKSCFENPESCYQIASWDWDKDDYVFSFCGDRPMDLTDSEWNDFRSLIKYGFEQLSNENSSDR